MLRAHASHFTPDRFDACRSDRMMVGSVLRWARNLAEAGALADKAGEVLQKVDAALAAMDRLAGVCIEAEIAATLAGEFDKPARSLLDGIAEDFEDVANPAEWPAWTDESAWTTTEPTPLALLIPPIRGGSPEAYEPTADDLAELSRWSAEFSAHLDDINGGIELSPSRFTEDDARAAGLAI